MKNKSTQKMVIKSKPKSGVKKPAPGKSRNKECKPMPPVVWEPQKRPVMERLFEEFLMIKSGTFPSMADMARALQVSVSTIKRDLPILTDRWKLPLEYHEAEHGFHFTRPVGNFPGLKITDEDMQTLVFMRNLIDLFPGASLAKNVESMFNEAVATLEDERRFSVEILRKSIYLQREGMDVVDPRSFTFVISALWERRVLEYEYRKPGGKYGLRRVHPWAITHSRGAWYMVGFCEEAQEERTFLLSRLRKPKLLRNKYTIPESFDAKKHFDKCFGVQSGKGDYKVVVKFDPHLADIYRTREWHPSQVREELEDGSALLTFRVSCLAEIKYTILLWGRGATVLEPAELVRDVVGELKATLANYEDGAGSEQGAGSQTMKGSVEQGGGSWKSSASAFAYCI